MVILTDCQGRSVVLLLPAADPACLLSSQVLCEHPSLSAIHPADTASAWLTLIRATHRPGSSNERASPRRQPGMSASGTDPERALLSISSPAATLPALSPIWGPLASRCPWTRLVQRAYFFTPSTRHACLRDGSQASSPLYRPATLPALTPRFGPVASRHPSNRGSSSERATYRCRRHLSCLPPIRVPRELPFLSTNGHDDTVS